MGAPAARAAELSRHWARMGHDVTVLTGFPNHPTGVVPEEWRVAIAPPSLHRNCRWRARRAHLALAAAQPQSARKNPQLRVILYFGSRQRAGSAEAGRGHRHLSAIAVRAGGMVAGVFEARPLRLRSARSLAGIARCRRRGQRRNVAPSRAGSCRRIPLPSRPTASWSCRPPSKTT